MRGCPVMGNRTVTSPLVCNYKRYYNRLLTYEWDEAKNRSNRAKHGLDFADAELVLNGPCVTFVDDRFDYGEPRFVALGSLAGRPVAIAYAVRGEAVRIISMRKANRREQKVYQERLGAD